MRSPPKGGRAGGPNPSASGKALQAAPRRSVAAPSRPRQARRRRGLDWAASRRLRRFWRLGGFGRRAPPACKAGFSHKGGIMGLPVCALAALGNAVPPLCPVLFGLLRWSWGFSPAPPRPAAPLGAPGCAWPPARFRAALLAPLPAAPAPVGAGPGARFAARLTLRKLSTGS